MILRNKREFGIQRLKDTKQAVLNAIQLRQKCAAAQKVCNGENLDAISNAVKLEPTSSISPQDPERPARGIPAWPPNNLLRMPENEWIEIWHKILGRPIIEN